MLELFPEGFEEIEGAGGLEIAAYTNAAGEERIWQAFGGAAVADVEEDWEDRWRQFHQPVRVGRLWIGPPWEEPDADAIAVVIDPGRAFGTGGHPTTRLCLELLEAEERGSVLDIGCGSGVLSIAAAKLGFAPVLAFDFDPQAVEASERNAADNGVSIDVRQADLREDELPATDLALANIAAEAVLALGSRAAGGACDHVRLPRLGRPRARRLPHRAARPGRRLGCGPPRTRVSLLALMASFSVRFLGCKVSQTDAQALRERLVRDGHREVDGARRRRRRQHVLRHERGLAKSRQAASRAARTHARVYVTGCGARLSDTAFAGLPANVTVVPGQIEQAVETVAGDVGAIGCVQADARLDRVRAFVKIQDGCSFSCAFCVIPLVRGATRSRSAEAVLGEIRRRVAQGHREIVLTGVNLGCFRDRAAGHTLPLADPRGGRDRRASSGCGSPRSRSTMSTTSSSRRCARRRSSARTCTCRSSPATTACSARWPAATPSRPTCASSSRSPASTSPPT